MSDSNNGDDDGMMYAVGDSDFSEEEHDKLFHDLYRGCSALLTEHAEQIMEETVSMVQSGMYTPDIIQLLVERYHLSEQLCVYFNNEAITAVRMKTLSAAEVQAVVHAYNESLLEHLASGQN